MPTTPEYQKARKPSNWEVQLDMYTAVQHWTGLASRYDVISVSSHLIRGAPYVQVTGSNGRRTEQAGSYLIPPGWARQTPENVDAWVG